MRCLTFCMLVAAVSNLSFSCFSTLALASASTRIHCAMQYEMPYLLYAGCSCLQLKMQLFFSSNFC